MTAGQHEFLERRQFRVEHVGLGFHFHQIVVGEGDGAGHRQFAAQIEQQVLDPLQQRVQIVV